MVSRGLAIGAATPVRQALAEPMVAVTDAYVAEELSDERILSMVQIGLPQRREAQTMEFARWDRLAERYDVEMPEIAQERLITENAPDSVFYLPMPTVRMG